MAEIDFKVKKGIVFAGLAGNANEIVTLASDGTLVASDVTVASISGAYTSADNAILSTVASISGSLQSQINAITVPTSATFLSDYDARYVNESDLTTTLGNYTLLSTTESISGGLNTRLTTLETNTANITGGLTQLDARYVNVTGDTMTGNLIITSDNGDPALQVNSDGDARIRLNNPTGNQSYSELTFANNGSDKYGFYNGDDGYIGLFDYSTNKDVFNYLTGTKKFTINPGYLTGYTFALQSSDDWIFRNNGSRLEIGAVEKIGTLRFYDIWANLQSEISWSEYDSGGVTTNDKFSLRSEVGDTYLHTNGLYSLGFYSYILNDYTFIVDNQYGGAVLPRGDFTISSMASISGANSLVAHDVDGKLFSTSIDYEDIATKQEVYNLDVDLQGQILNVLNPAEVANISGSAVTIDSFPHYNEIGSVQWLVHLDDGTNVRFSQVMVTYLPNSTIKFTEESVESIGTTTDAVLSATTDATNVYLKLTSSNLWNFKTKRINL